jgi:hypothetical protein
MFSTSGKTFQAWAAMAPDAMLADMQAIMPQACAASMQTPEGCKIPYTLSLDPNEYLTKLGAVAGAVAAPPA